jgi:hypothetical protein
MKKTLLSLSILLTGYCGFAQYEGFENWTQGSVLTLDDYETSANELGAFGNLPTSRVTDAVDGTYSIKLETVVIPSGDTVFGYFVSGDPEAQTPGQTVTLVNVDSITGYYKYDILAGDSSIILAGTSMTGLGTTGGGTFTISSGTQSTWKRFAYYIGATSADSLFLAVATGNPLAEYPGKIGSWIMYDNIQLKSSTGTTQNIINHSFENWSTITWDDLDNWSTSNQWVIGESSLPVKKTTDAYAGTYALELELFSTSEGDTAWAAVTNGIFGHSQLEGGAPFTSSPTGFEFYYKYIPSGIDTAWVSFEFKKTGFPSQHAGTILYNTANSYTLYSGFVPNVTPDSLLIQIQAGKNIGTNLKIDNINFIYPVSVNDNIKIDRLESYPNPTSDILNLRFELKNSNIVTANLLDITGKVLSSKSFGNLASGTYNESFNTSSYTSGIYFIEFTIGNEKIVNRFIVK